MSVKKLYVAPFEVPNRAKMIISANKLPQSEDRSDGLYRRLIIVKLKKQFLDGKGDPYLAAKLELELPGICNRFLQAYNEVRKTRLFTVPKGVLADLKKYREESSTVIRFFSDCVAVVDTDEDVKQAEFYSAYVTWCELNGERPMSSIAFYREVRRDIVFDFDERLFRKRTGSAVATFIKGLKINKEF